MFRSVLSSSVGILLLVLLVVSPLVLWVLLLESRRFLFRCIWALLASRVVVCSVVWGYSQGVASFRVPWHGGDLGACEFRGMWPFRVRGASAGWRCRRWAPFEEVVS